MQGVSTIMDIYSSSKREYEQVIDLYKLKLQKLNTIIKQYDAL